MTTDRHLERDLPSILGEIATGPYPDYIDDVLATTSHRRQRLAWTFPERWLPVDIATQPVTRPALPWRQLGVLALIALILAAAVAAYVGSQPRLPPPFGTAANGLVAYETGGDIYTTDPTSGVAKAIVMGPETDMEPTFSRDGTRIAFERYVTLLSRVPYVASADGAGPIPLTSEPVEKLANLAFSPDGSEVLFTSGADAPELWIAKTDGSGSRRIDVGMGVIEPSFRPPDGAEIVFASAASIEDGNGIYAVELATAKVRPILTPGPGVHRDRVRLSPDGSRIAYSAASIDPDSNTYRVHVVDIDGTGDVIDPAADDCHVPGCAGLVEQRSDDRRHSRVRGAR